MLNWLVLRGVNAFIGYRLSNLFVEIFLLSIAYILKLLIVYDGKPKVVKKNELKVNEPQVEDYKLKSKDYSLKSKECT